MRIYIIANDGITLSREAPAAMTEGEIAVASKEELHAAPRTTPPGIRVTYHGGSTGSGLGRNIESGETE